jgi:hypothetical protein
LVNTAISYAYDISIMGYPFAKITKVSMQQCLLSTDTYNQRWKHS